MTSICFHDDVKVWFFPLRGVHTAGIKAAAGRTAVAGAGSRHPLFWWPRCCPLEGESHFHCGTSLVMPHNWELHQGWALEREAFRAAPPDGTPVRTSTSGFSREHGLYLTRLANGDIFWQVCFLKMNTMSSSPRGKQLTPFVTNDKNSRFQKKLDVSSKH